MKVITGLTTPDEGYYRFDHTWWRLLQKPPERVVRFYSI